MVVFKRVDGPKYLGSQFEVWSDLELVGWVYPQPEDDGLIYGSPYLSSTWIVDLKGYEQKALRTDMVRRWCDDRIRSNGVESPF